MATAVGAGFDISKLLDGITKADEALTNLMDKNKQASRSIITSFQQIANQGVVPYTQSLEKNLSIYNSIREAITDTSGKAKRDFGDMKSEIDKVINSTETLMTSLSMSPQFKYELQVKAASDYRDQMVRIYTEMFDTIEKRTTQNQSAKHNSQEYAKNYQQQLSMYERMFDEIAEKEKKARKEASDYESRLYQDNLAKYKKNKDDQAKVDRHYHAQRQREYEEMFRAIERTQQRERAIQNAKGDTSKGALNYYNRMYSDKGVLSIQNMQTALSKLRDAQKRLDLSTENGKKRYKELGDAINMVEKDMKKYSSSADDINKKHRNLMDTSGQLARAFAAIFSVSAIKGYMGHLISIRKEFELQQKSLSVLLQSKDEANKLWQQTLDLAIKSPFRVKELVTYTKQLSAYRVESDKLFDTTKRLADVSAGLGVDMNRLILAFGQVKSANFLRGTELRQFTEAGIPMLEELAKYFSELQGRAVSVGEVFERISKRMVSFADVETVFHRMTDAGGTFYKMQEEQSQTLSGMISNLHDSIDIMLNDIGKANDGILKGGVEAAKYFVDNWEAIAKAIRGVIVALAGYKLYQLAARESIMLTAIDMNILTNAEQKNLTMTQLLKVGFGSLAKSAKAAGVALKSMFAFNLPLMAVTALISGAFKLISAWREHKKELEDISNKYDDLRKKVEHVSVDFKTSSNDKNIDEQKNKLKELVSIANKEYNMKIALDVDNLDAKQVVDKFNEISSQVFEANIFAEHFAKQMQKASEWTIQDDIFQDFDQLGAKSSEMLEELSLNRERVVFNLQEAYTTLNEEQRKALSLLEKPKDVDESEVQYLERLRKGYSLLLKDYKSYVNALDKNQGNTFAARREREELKGFGIDAKVVLGVIESTDDAVIEARKEFENFAKTINISESLSDEQKEIRLKTAIDKVAAEKGWNDFVKDYIMRWTENEFKIKFTPEQKDNKTLAPWIEKYNEFVRKNLKLGKVLEMDSDTSFEQYLSTLKGEYELYAKEIKAWDAGNAKARAQYSGKEINAIKAQNAERKKAIDWLEYDEKKSGGESEELKRLRKQISLIREAARAYDEMRKLHDEAYAEKHVTSEYGAAFKEAGLGDIGGYAFGTREDELNNLNKLKTSAAQVKGGMLELSKATAQVGVQVDNANQELADKKLFDSISNIFSNYEISLEMDKLNIPQDLAKRLFGLDSISLEELRPAILEKFNMSGMKELSNEQIYESDAFKSMSEARQKELKESLEKEAKMTKDARIERLKTYSQYLVKEQHERIKFKMEEIRKLSEIDSMSEFNEDEKAVMKENIRRETNENMAKSYWEDFEKSPMFVNLFDDMELATKQSLNNMKTHLESMRDSMIAAGLPASDLKEILDKINQVEEELEERDPFSGLKSLGAVMFGTGGDSTVSRKEFKEAKTNEATYLANAETLKIQEGSALRLYETQKATLKIEEDRLKELPEGSKEYEEQRQKVDTLRDGVSAANKYHQSTVQAIEENNKKLNQAKNTTKQWKEQVKDVGDGFSFVQNTVNQVGDALRTTLQQTGLMGEEDAAIFDSAMNVANSALGLGASIASGDIVGIITNGLSLIGNIAATGDAAKQKAINAELEKAKQSEKIYNDLVDKYEKLQKAMEKSFTIEQMNVTQKAMEQNMSAQKESIEEQIAALESANAIESDKKKTDQAAIDERNAQIEELRKQQEELIEQQEEIDKQFVETLGGSHDYTGVAEQFLDSWLSAFEETGDGMKGLEDSFDDFWKNVIKKQVVYGGASKIMKKYLDGINTALENGVISESEQASLEKLEATVKENLNNFYNQMNDKYNLTDSETSLSGLQKGIQGITEDQAEILSAYWNAVRFDVSAIRRIFENYVSAENNTYTSPMVSYLDSISKQTAAIYELLDSARGNNVVANAINVRVLDMP